jgi:hypothetical protein
MKSNTDVQVSQPIGPARDRRQEALADAIERFAGYGYIDGQGFACHGPMGAEALSTLGHDELVADWAEGYKARHAPIAAPPPAARLDPADEASWRPAIGDPSRVADWADLFTDRLREHPWPDVVRTWLPRLLPGHSGALTHGLLRTAHAIRALPADGAPAEVLLDELARGLAYWAATFHDLPTAAGTGESAPPERPGSLPLDAAIARLPHPDEPWSPIEAGTFSRLDELAAFPAAVSALAPPPSLDEGLSDLTAAFCRVLLAHPQVFPQGLVHAVTPVAAVRTLVPYLPDGERASLYARMWRTSAAIVCGFTPPPARDGEPGHAGDRLSDADADDEPGFDDVIARAVEHRDPHAVKFTEACAREHALRPDPVYARAARHVVDHTPPW